MGQKVLQVPSEVSLDLQATEHGAQTEERIEQLDPGKIEEPVNATAAAVSQHLEATISTELGKFGDEMRSVIEEAVGNAIGRHLAPGMEALIAELSRPASLPPRSEQPEGPWPEDRVPSDVDGPAAETPVDDEPAIRGDAPRSFSIIKAADPKLAREVMPIDRVLGSGPDLEAVPDPSPPPSEPEPPVVPFARSRGARRATDALQGFARHRIAAASGSFAAALVASRPIRRGVFCQSTGPAGAVDLAANWRGF